MKISSDQFSLMCACLVICLSHSHEQFDKLIDRWNSLATIEGQFDNNHTLFQKAKCSPCDYLIVIYQDYIQLLIEDPEEGRQDEIKAFQFGTYHEHQRQTMWDFDSQRLKISTGGKSDIKQTIQKFTRNGLEWKYQLTLPIQGIILKNKTPPKGFYLIPFIALLFSVLVFLYMPLNANTRNELFLQVPRRTPLLSLLIMSQLQHIVLLEIVVTGIKYLIYEQSFLAKSMWYVLFMIPFGFTIIHILYIYDSIRMSYQKTVDKVIQSHRLKDLGLIVAFFVGIYGVCLGLLFLDKGIWVFYYFMVYFIWQVGWSLLNKVYPFLASNIYFIILVGFQMFLANYEPLFWFNQLTRKQMTTFWAAFVGIYLLGSLIQKLMIGVQIVNQVLFQQSKQMQMADQVSAKQTQQNLQAQA